MLEKEYKIEELTELYEQGFFKNTRVGQEIEDMVAEFKENLLRNSKIELANATNLILQEEGIETTDEFYEKYIADKRRTRVNMALFSFIKYLKSNHPEMIRAQSESYDDNFADLKTVRLQFRNARNYFNDLHLLYKNFYDRNNFTYINQRLFLEKLSEFPYDFRIDPGKVIPPEYFK